MKHSFKKLPGSRIELTADLSLPEFRAYWNEAMAEARAGIEIKGFRKGMAPEKLVEQAIDQKKLADEAAQRAVRKTLHRIIEEEGWIIIDRPNVELVDGAASFSYTATFSIFPEVVLPDYASILEKRRAELNKKKEALTITEEEFTKAIEWLRKARTNEGGPALSDDAFAQSVGNFKTFEELKKSVMEGLLLEKRYREDERACLHILEEIALASTIDLPAVMVEKVKEQNQNLDEATAKKRLLTHLVIHTIAQKEKLQPTEEEVEQEVARHPENLKKSSIDNRKFYDYIYERIQQQKVYAKLLGTNGN